MRIVMFEAGALAAILENGQFLAYAMNLEISPSAFLKLVISCIEISFQILYPARCIRACMPGAWTRCTTGYSERGGGVKDEV